MKRLFFFLFAAAVAASCTNNDTATASAPLCDTACSSDSFMFTGEHKLKPVITLTQKNCVGDMLSWTHDRMPSKQKMTLTTLLDTSIRVNKSAISCVMKDTSYAWLTFNDCISGRGYLVQVFFSDAGRLKKITSALNSFDKKFVVDDSLRAYCDYSAIYVVNVNTGKKTMLDFKKK